MRRTRIGNRGFSLIEMAVVVFLAGFLMLIMTSILTGGGTAGGVAQQATGGTAGGIVAGKPTGDQLALMRKVVTGFIRARNRLPCPDSTGNGEENCAVRVGGVPYRTLGLGRPALNQYGHALHYGIYRASSGTASEDADLGVLKDRFQPLLPNGQHSAVSNGLDFCQALFTAARNDATNNAEIRSNGIHPAFLLADPGQTDASGNGTLFDGSNATGLEFEPPGQAADATYDDKVSTVGFNELSAELGCPALVARINAAARSAYAAYDIHRAEVFYRDFRSYVKDLSNTNLEIAELRQFFAQFNVGLAAATSATDIAVALSSASGATAIAISAANAAIAISMAADSMDSAQEQYDAKENEYNNAVDRLAGAEDRVDRALADRDAWIQECKDLDAKGWFQ